MKRRLARIAAGAAALAVGAVGMIGVGVAQADPATPDYGNIDPNKNQHSSITLHKFLNQATESDADIGDPESGFTQPVEGVVFSIAALGKMNGGQFEPLDLTIPENWDALSEVELDGCKVSNTETTDIVVAPANSIHRGTFPATGSDGKTTLDELRLAGYLICETNVDNAMVDGQPVTISRAEKPFIVTLPQPYKDGWLYDVNAFPKNQAFKDAEVQKSVSPQGTLGLKDGSQVHFPVEITVPTTVGNWPHGAVTDVFQLGLTAAPNPVVSVDVLDTTGTSVLSEPCEEGANKCYEVEVKADGSAVAVVFTEDGLSIFDNNQLAGKNLKIVFAAVVNTAVLGNDAAQWEIPNTAGIWTSQKFDPSGDWAAAPLKTNEVKTNWGSVEIFKYTVKGEGENAEQIALEDAEFKLYPAATSYPDANGKCSATTLGSAEVLYTLTTNDEGLVRSGGLYVSDETNHPNDSSRCYVLEEVKAPAGYEKADGKVAVKLAIGKNNRIEIENTQQTVPDLPLTGAAGKLLLMLAGLAAAAIVVGAVLANKRKTKEVLG